MPNDAPNSQPAELFDQLLESLRTLLDEIPRISQALGRNLNEALGGEEAYSAWQAMRVRYESLQFCHERNTPPPLVAVLLGPSGAGKSTWFRLLTGIPVPVDPNQRPTTHSRVIAVPPELADEAFLRGIFPDNQLRRLQPNSQELQQLTEQHPLDAIFYVPSTHPLGRHLIVADVPDFNTVEYANWPQAERMLERAELVIYLCHPEDYTGDRVVEILQRCCQLAAHLVYVFTKTSPTPDGASRDGTAMRSRLLDKLAKHERNGQRPFLQHRQDGQSLLDFLRRCPFYSSPRPLDQGQETLPRLEAVVAISPADAPQIRELLQGQDANRLVRKGLRLAIGPALRACCTFLEQVIETRRQLRAYIADVARIIRRCVDSVRKKTLEDLQGRLGDLVLDEANNQLPSFLRQMLEPLGAFHRPQVGEPREERGRLEKTHLRTVITQAIPRLRKLRREAQPIQQERLAPSTVLSDDRLDAARRNFMKHLKRGELGQPTTEWDNYIRQYIAEQCRNQRGMAFRLVFPQAPLAIWVLALLLILIVVAILAILSHFLGFLALVIGIIVAIIVGTIVWSWIGNLRRQQPQLQQRLQEEAKQKLEQWWAQERRTELMTFLICHFKAPLIEPWRRHLLALDDERIKRCKEACDFLDRYLVDA